MGAQARQIVLKFCAEAEFFTLTFAARMPLCRFCRIFSVAALVHRGFCSHARYQSQCLLRVLLRSSRPSRRLDHYSVMGTRKRHSL